ncbi:hypothetical protein B0H12DRAFT_1158712, partial [Mycena haematopus]
ARLARYARILRVLKNLDAMNSKTLTFYTNTSSATRRLRTPVQIVLTLSLDKPVTHRNSKQPHDDRPMEPQPPIAWQVLQFDLPNSNRNVSVDYTAEWAAGENLNSFVSDYEFQFRRHGGRIRN